MFVPVHDTSSNLPKKGKAKDGFLNESTWKHVKIDGGFCVCGGAKANV